MNSSNLPRLSYVFGVLTLLVASYSYATTTFKIATTYPDGTAPLIELKKAADLIEERTDGAVKFKYYAGGVMGDDFTVKRKIRARQLHGGIVQTGVYAPEVPNLNLYSIPMLFRNNEEANAVRKQIDPILFRELEESEIIPLGFIGLGFAYAMGTKSIEKLQEIRRSKVWAPKDDPGAEHNLKVFGINPIPLPLGDVLTGLQTGLIDTVASPPVVALALQWHNQIKYILDLRLLYVYAIFSLDQRMFERLNEEHQEVVRSVMRDAVVRIEEKLIADHDESLEIILEQDIEFIKPTAESLDEWYTLSEDAAIQWLENDMISRENYELLEEALERFRNRISP